VVSVGQRPLPRLAGRCGSGAEQGHFVRIERGDTGGKPAGVVRLPNGRRHKSPFSGFYHQRARTLSYSFDILENALRELSVFLNSGRGGIILGGLAPCSEPLKDRSCSTGRRMCGEFVKSDRVKIVDYGAANLYGRRKQDGSAYRSGDVVERHLSRECSAFTTTSRSANGGHPLGGLSAAR